MQIVRWADADQAALEACCEVRQAAMRADDPAGPPMSMRRLRVWIEHPTAPTQTWYVPGETPGSAVGAYHLVLPDRQNRDQAGLDILVHPGYRRRGIGVALLRHAARQAAEDARSILRGSVIEGAAGEAFARHRGGEPGLADARRVLVVGKVPAGAVAALRDSAAKEAAGYSLVSWTGRTPDQYLAGFAAVSNALSDAPRDPGFEARTWDEQRIREHVDDQRDLFGSRGYLIAALHSGTGEMAAISHVEVDPELPEWGYQLITAVARQHRGHRLGLLTKAAMLDWLASAEPALQRIVTWNAASNEHMIAINDTLGYELLEPQTRSYQVAVADVLR